MWGSEGFEPKTPSALQDIMWLMNIDTSSFSGTPMVKPVRVSSAYAPTPESGKKYFATI